MRLAEIHLVRKVLPRVWGIIDAFESLELLIGQMRNVLSEAVQGDKNASAHGDVW
jgi:hypothetical protein